MNVLVTGPFGTIGAHVVARLLDEGHRVTCLDLDSPASRAKAAALPEHVTVRFGDVTRTEDVAEAVRGMDAVIHLAAVIPPASERLPELAERVNVGGTRHVLDAIARVAPHAVLVFPSSISVHGYSAGRTPPCTIDAPFDGRDDYARHKVACEALIRASDVRAVILRIGACADPHDLSKGGGRDALAKMLAIAPDTRVEYLHPEDAATALVRACGTPEAVGKALFLGSGASSQLTWRAFLSTVPRAMGLGELPEAWFGDAPYYTDWMDTAESERLLRYQRLGYPAYRAAIERRWWPLRVLLTPLRPLPRFALGRAIASARRPSP